MIMAKKNGWHEVVNNIKAGPEVSDIVHDSIVNRPQPQVPALNIPDDDDSTINLIREIANVEMEVQAAQLRVLKGELEDYAEEDNYDDEAHGWEDIQGGRTAENKNLERLIN